MAGRKALGLDELMIVNPCSCCPGPTFMGERDEQYDIGADVAAVDGGFFLGEDGTLYEMVE